MFVSSGSYHLHIALSISRVDLKDLSTGAAIVLGGSSALIGFNVEADQGLWRNLVRSGLSAPRPNIIGSKIDGS